MLSIAVLGSAIAVVLNACSPQTAVNGGPLKARSTRSVDRAEPSARPTSSGAPSSTPSTSSAPSYHGPSWISYLNTHEGRSCVLRQNYLGTVITNTVTVRRVHVDPTGARVLTRLAVRSSDRSDDAAPESVPYLIHPDGTLGTYPGLEGNSEFSYRIMGSILYPSPLQLAAGRSIKSSLTAELVGRTATFRKAFSSLTTSGGPLVARAAFRVSPAPHVAKLVAPAGTFRNIIGVVIKPLTFTVVNLNPKGKKAIGAASSIEKALAGHGYRLYYAKGVGLVEQSQPSLKLKLRLAGCRN